MLRAFKNPTNNPNNRLKTYPKPASILKPRQFIKSQPYNLGKHTLTINPKTY